ncbi:asparagine synthase-related protein [Sphingobium yanoikuyae]|jgi:asparagine synthase (glutamine-hydrolysing)|uniref:asparagine synthase-related protein n=3 Tax=Sphingobium yanoikuyae TaxID=13690 RepID=UPI0018AFA1CC|nr:asparagine synthase C-terminal domain-containing protein [Sphingobium yanoikuyae]MDV3482006.1 asparagine synthase C-terminal domain-containing protein [Sphingobium yanoikuyae]
MTLPSNMTSHSIAPNMLVAVNDGQFLHRLPENAGVVIGTLFHRHGSPQAIRELPISDADSIVASSGRHLVDRLWGSYAALLSTKEGHLLLRDPSGMLTCYYLALDELVVVVSDPSLLVAAGFIEPEIDSKGLLRALVLAGLPEERTALVGVNYVLAGSCAIFGGKTVSTVMKWNPWEYVANRQNRGYEEMSEDLHRITSNCVSAWGGRHHNILIGVSGGLDSSIVAELLSRRGINLSCMTMKTNDPLGDESRFCKIFSDHIGVPLHERKYNIRDIDLGRSSVEHMAKPFGRLDSMAYDAAIIETADQVGAEAIFSGNGGDNVFYMSHSARPLADRYISEGLAGAWATLKDLSSLTGANAIQVVRHAFAAWRKFGQGYAWQVERGFLSSSALSDGLGGSVDHPWLAPPAGLGLPGRVAHVAMLIRMQYSIDAYRERGGIPFMHPLASQPVVEYCLGIPTWHQCNGGRDRAVARHAFVRQLPAEVINRRTKGSPQGFIFDIYKYFRTEITDRLLGGFLAGSGFLDRAELEATLCRGASISAVDVMHILLLVDAEAWVSSWQSKKRGNKINI